LDDVEKAAPIAYELLRRFWTDVDGATNVEQFSFTERRGSRSASGTYFGGFGLLLAWS